jgi:2-oxoglutarate ferredoxin oxidoreductase subunit beta
MENNKFETKNEITWCPGCGGYGFLTALKTAFSKMELLPKDIVAVYDIGCSANMINFLPVCGVSSLHGRSIPFAIGVKMANPNLTVIAQGGEGGILTEGANHFIHAAQRDDDITVLINNNFVFGLTTGQTSAGTPKGTKTKTTPQGNPHNPLSAVSLAVVSGASFIARTYAFDIPRTTEIISEAIKHKGFSVVEIIQPCVVWTKELIKQEGSWLDKPFDNPLDIIGKENLWGILCKK